MNAAVQKRLDEQFPKKCGCGRVWAVDGSHFDWKSLPLKGSITDEFATMEMRNCTCNSTLAVLTQIHNLDLE